MRRGWRTRLRGNWLLVIVAVGCAAAIALEILLLNMPPNPTPPGTTVFPGGPEVTIDSVDLIASYQTPLNDSSYLTQSDCGCEPFGVAPGGEFQWWIRFGNLDKTNHTILKLSISSPFSLQRIFPTTPMVIPGGGEANVTLFVQVPQTGGTYLVTGEVETA